MKKHTRSVFALLLVVLMAVGMMPFGAFATDTGTDPAEVTEEPIEPEVPLSEKPTEHDITEPVEESDIEVPAEIQLATRYSAGSNITVYNYFHAFFVISEMNCIDGSPFLTSKSSWPGDSPSDWGSCGGKYDLFYCIDFYAHGNANGATTKPGTPLEETPAWKAISSAGKKGIQLALIYGVPNCSSYYDNVYGYEATQIIIWEYQLGVRTDASQTVSFFNTTLGKYKHRRNLNVLVCGGSGAGKTRFYAKPNIMNANTSFVCLDPKGELLRDTGNLLKRKGYDIKVIDLINMEKSHCYNPFVYLKTDNDVQKLATNLFKNTTPKGSQSQDPFWDQAAMMLLLALMFYLHYEAPEDEQNFPMVMEMIRAGEVKEDDEAFQSPLDILFRKLEMKNPEHIALKYYKAYHSGSGKTLKSIQITLISRLEKFNLTSLAGITQTDELDLAQVGEKKTAIYAVIPDNDASFNFIVGMLYTQLFQQLYYQADVVHGGALPVHVHFVMDEFANVALPDEFDKLLATMRSREISVSIIVQNLAQLKKLFEKEWESIVGNCDEFLYLGGNEQSTHEYVSKLLGKETIDTNTYGQSKGRSGSYSTNWQITGRELMTPDEVRMLDNRYALLFIRGERPIQDFKYDILKHPNVTLTTDGKAEPYQHGLDNLSIASIVFDKARQEQTGQEPEVDEDRYELISDEEIEEFLKKQEENEHEETQKA